VSTILAIAGSLRRGSFNRMLVRAAVESAPAGMIVHPYDELAAIPLFNEDLEAETPESVTHFRSAAASADGLLISTPEYNWSISGVLKNAIDWLSRPDPSDLLAGKPIAIIGASGGRWGTRLAQATLRQVLTSTESLVMPAPAMFVREAAALFDGTGHLTDATARAQLESVLSAFAQWIADVRR
jgi:chromate reductase